MSRIEKFLLYASAVCFAFCLSTTIFMEYYFTEHNRQMSGDHIYAEMVNHGVRVFLSEREKLLFHGFFNSGFAFFAIGFLVVWKSQRKEKLNNTKH